MAAINDLISQIQDETLRNRIQEEVSKMAKQKKFGLVFEEHMPESTPLYDMPIKRGCNVMRRDSKDDKSIYVVLKVEGDTAVCVKPEQKDEAVTFELKDIVRVAEFGESIYPYLKPVDSVCNAPDSDLWHTLIEADNYHALQLLEYLYAGKVDCIYIDPPYNTGAKDWKYNNDYVDGNDAYRHSKWLSFIERRLRIAKRLLNPKTGVLIVTIDEHEVHHLRVLLEELYAFKVDCILFAFDSECIAELNKYAEKKFHELNDQYRKYIVVKPEKCQKQYSDIVANGDEISKHNFTLPETISAKVEADGIKYTDHLFANADGIAKIKLNGWEQTVLAEEQKREDYVCWLRNPSRQSWSLRMPYEMDGKCKELYPDFIIVRQDPILKYIVDILEPHNPDFKDNLGKAKGLANYAANEPRIGRVQLIRIGKDAAGKNRFKRLDLAKGSIRNKVLAAINTDELDHIFDTDGVFED